MWRKKFSPRCRGILHQATRASIAASPRSFPSLQRRGGSEVIPKALPSRLTPPILARQVLRERAFDKQVRPAGNGKPRELKNRPRAALQESTS